MSKLSVVYAALATEQGIWLAFVVVVLGATVVEAGYFFRLIQTLYFKEGEELARRAEAPLSGLVPVVVLGTLIILIGVFPQVVAPIIEGGAEELLQRADYVRVVLGLP
jgi:NADH:ubiquinone oxidoreductase subunit 2 (subunit N)